MKKRGQKEKSDPGEEGKMRYERAVEEVEMQPFA